MSEVWSFVRPIVSGLVGALFVYLLVRATKPHGRKSGDLRIMEYSSGFKIFTILLVPFAAFVAYAAANARSSQLVIAFIVAACFLAAAVFFAYQVFFVRFSYDDNSVYYQSPLCGKVTAPWTSLTDVGHSGLLQADYIVVTGIGRIWCSNMLNGYAELGEFLEKKTQELFPENGS